MDILYAAWMSQVRAVNRGLQSSIAPRLRYERFTNIASGRVYPMLSINRRVAFGDRAYTRSRGYEPVGHGPVCGRKKLAPYRRTPLGVRSGRAYKTKYERVCRETPDNAGTAILHSPLSRRAPAEQEEYLVADIFFPRA